MIPAAFDSVNDVFEKINCGLGNTFLISFDFVGTFSHFTFCFQSICIATKFYLGYGNEQPEYSKI